MNNRQLFLAWLRTTSPQVYTAAIRQALRQPQTLGGLNCDLVNSMTAPATFGAFGQDDSGDGGLPEITISAPSVDQSAPQIIPLTPADIALSDVGTGITQIDVTQPDLPIVTNPSTGTTTAGSNTIWNSIVTAVGNVGAAAFKADTQSNLVKLNTQRASMGLPPVNANGQVVTAGFAPATNAIYSLENAIGGVGAGGGSLFLIAGVGLLAFMLLRKK